MKLQRYQDDYSGCEPHPHGQYVEYDDVIALLKKLSKELDGPDVLFELEDADLNGSTLVDQYIRENTE